MMKCVSVLVGPVEVMMMVIIYSNIDEGDDTNWDDDDGDGVVREGGLLS